MRNSQVLMSRLVYSDLLLLCYVLTKFIAGQKSDSRKLQ
jgi:hypothetical protein